MQATGGIPYRRLGKTGEMVSLVGIGGGHIGRIQDDAESIRLIRRALDEGINFMDNSWDYHNGRSEERMGQALRDGYRQKAFLMTKIDGQTRQSALEQLDESLRRLQVDTVDLLQMHEIIRPEDPDRIFAPGGAAEALKEAKQAGKIRYIGFTGHKDPSIHLKMLQVAREHDFAFDTVQMPLNVMDAHFRSFEKNVLPVLIERGIAPLAMKPLGGGKIMNSATVSAIEALHYAMNLPVSVVICGCDSMERLDQALEAVRTFKPMDASTVADLLTRTAEAARAGEFELFKTGSIYDATNANPQWLGLNV